MKVKLYLELSDSMKKVGILTLNGNYNFGNKLQNYALIKFIEENFECKCDTIWTNDTKTCNIFKQLIRKMLKRKGYIREKKFKEFNKYLNIKKTKVNLIKDEYDKYIIGSDQVWNYNDPIFSAYKYFALFAEPQKNISYAASFGVSNIEDEYIDIFINGLSNLKYISVRELSGKKMVEKITNRKDIELVIDPTMLLSPKEWEKILAVPRQYNDQKFILNYFLGNLTDDRIKEIKRVAHENDCFIINILDKNDPYYTCGPSEFLWLIKKSSLVCTDSFHASVFSLLFDKSFIVFDREDDLKKMNSRIDNLLETYQLENRRFEGKIILDNMKHDYSNAYKILEGEIAKSRLYLEKILEDR